MDIEIDKAAEQRLTGFLDLIGDVLQYPQRRENFAQYALGLIGHERKTIEAIAVRNCPDVTKADAAHQRLHDFITDSRWDDHAVHLAAARYALEPMTQVTNCQIGVSLTLATPQDHLPVASASTSPSRSARRPASGWSTLLPVDAVSPSPPAISRNNSSPTTASVVTRGERAPARR